MSIDSGVVNTIGGSPTGQFLTQKKTPRQNA